VGAGQVAEIGRLAELPGWRWTAAETAADRMLDQLTAHIVRLGSAKQVPHGPSIYAGARRLGVWAAARRQDWLVHGWWQ
jgi:hypothetical protein